MKTKKGVTRIVFVFGTFVVKIPNFMHCWQHFLQGVLSNINENETWKIISEFKKEISHLICPVIWCSWGGWIIIMKKADTAAAVNGTWDNTEHMIHFAGDDTVSNYGVFEDRLVKIDYGQVHLLPNYNQFKELAKINEMLKK